LEVARLFVAGCLLRQAFQEQGEGIRRCELIEQWPLTKGLLPTAGDLEVGDQRAPTALVLKLALDVLGIAERENRGVDLVRREIKSQRLRLRSAEMQGPAGARSRRRSLPAPGGREGLAVPRSSSASGFLAHGPGYVCSGSTQDVVGRSRDDAGRAPQSVLILLGGVL
jgi:hypothetical protein